MLRNSRRVLYVAYPLLPVTDASPGGAEQILAALEREFDRTGWSTTLAACSGSEAQGGLFVTGPAGAGSLKSAECHEDKQAHKILELISVREAVGRGFHLIHDHSGSFFRCADQVETPMLATLHLPRSFYPAHLFTKSQEDLYFNCVSESQAKSFAGVSKVLGAVANGISLERFPLETSKQNYLLWLGRICEEKGAHIALDVAEKAGIPMVLAGKVYPLAYHQEYFECQIVPRLQRMGNSARFVETPRFEDKVALVRGAKAVLIPSLADETSSLVAMEAAACGTPVVAFRRGALPEVVSHGQTGLLVDTLPEMLRALAQVGKIKPKTCHDYAQRHFSAKRMAAGYAQLYERISAKKPQLHAA